MRAMRARGWLREERPDERRASRELPGGGTLGHFADLRRQARAVDLAQHLLLVDDPLHAPCEELRRLHPDVHEAHDAREDGEQPVHGAARAGGPENAGHDGRLDQRVEQVRKPYRHREGPRDRGGAGLRHQRAQRNSPGHAEEHPDDADPCAHLGQLVPVPHLLSAPRHCAQRRLRRGHGAREEELVAEVAAKPRNDIGDNRDQKDLRLEGHGEDLHEERPRRAHGGGEILRDGSLEEGHERTSQEHRVDKEAIDVGAVLLGGLPLVGKNGLRGPGTLEGVPEELDRAPLRPLHPLYDGEDGAEVVLGELRAMPQLQVLALDAVHLHGHVV
mmetsp:Transcript_8961/g.24324  ORF Transcript_8961/g.24324 Transcript_8961/m.24324 type:complete len:331 (-) Transcript_8961:709-1701(-)